MKHNLTLSTHMRVGEQIRKLPSLPLYLVQIILSGRYAGKKGKQLAAQSAKVEVAVNDLINTLHRIFMEDYLARGESIPKSPYCNTEFWLINPKKTGGSLYTARYQKGKNHGKAKS